MAQAVAVSRIYPHDDRAQCTRRQATREPGRRGCVLEGRVSRPPWAAMEAPRMTPHARISPEWRGEVIAAMKGVFGDDIRRIEHALRVLGFAEAILAQEPGCPGSREVVIAAAILHDIGIHQAEVKHGSAAGRYQEIEGPPIARGILERLGFD